MTASERTSPAIASATPGYWTLTATGVPSDHTARWTWPMDAAAVGCSSNSRKRARHPAPISATRTGSTSSNGRPGLSSCSAPRAPCQELSGSAGNRASTVDRSWPSFNAPPFSPPSVVRVSSAVATRACSRSAARSCPSSPRAWIDTARPTARAGSPAIAALRRTREVGTGTPQYPAQRPGQQRTPGTGADLPALVLPSVARAPVWAEAPRRYGSTSAVRKHGGRGWSASAALDALLSPGALARWGVAPRRLPALVLPSVARAPVRTEAPRWYGSTWAGRKREGGTEARGRGGEREGGTDGAAGGGQPKFWASPR